MSIGKLRKIKQIGVLQLVRRWLVFDTGDVGCQHSSAPWSGHGYQYLSITKFLSLLISANPSFIYTGIYTFKLPEKVAKYITR